jgi:hypothetical protein
MNLSCVPLVIQNIFLKKSVLGFLDHPVVCV